VTNTGWADERFRERALRRSMAQPRTTTPVHIVGGEAIWGEGIPGGVPQIGGGGWGIVD